MSEINIGSYAPVYNCSNCPLWDNCPYLEERETIMERNSNLYSNQCWCKDNPDLIKYNKL